MPKKLIFMGSPDFATPTLQTLLKAGHDITAVYTQPPRPAGRGQKLTPTAVHALAEEHGLPVFTPEKLRGEALETLLEQANHVDAVVVVAYGLLLPAALVDNYMCLNLHPSALPRWRGAAPLQHTLMAGDKTTEVCIMKLDAGMDTGDVFSRTALELPNDVTLGDLHDITAQLGAENMLKVVNHLEVLSPIPQPTEGVTLAHKISKVARRLNWSQPAEVVHNHIRGLSPFPVATTVLRSEAVKLYASRVASGENAQNPKAKAGEVVSLQPLCVACGDGGMLELLELQPAGSTRQAAQAFVQRVALKMGECFTMA